MALEIFSGWNFYFSYLGGRWRHLLGDRKDLYASNVVERCTGCPKYLYARREIFTYFLITIKAIYLWKEAYDGNNGIIPNVYILSKLLFSIIVEEIQQEFIIYYHWSGNKHDVYPISLNDSDTPKYSVISSSSSRGALKRLYTRKRFLR